jgi:hypothetical protein
MKFDLLERRTFYPVIVISFLVFLFLPFNLGMEILFFSLFVYFLVIFILCSYWANEWHPERKFVIGFLVSFLHSFVFLLGGFLGLVLAQIALKIFPLLIEYFRGIWRF